jgi:hypothetical protein
MFARFNMYDWTIIGGAAVMAWATLFPLVRLPLVGTINYIANGKGDGIIILILAASIIASVIVKQRRIAAILGTIALAVMLMTLIRLLDKLTTFTNKLHPEATIVCCQV